MALLPESLDDEAESAEEESALDLSFEDDVSEELLELDALSVR